MDAAKPQMPAPVTKPRKRSWARRVLVAVFALAVVIYFIYTPIMSRIIGGKLQDAVDRRLHADLRYDSLTYIFPYGVRIKNARLCADETLGGEELLKIDELDLTLAKLPLPHTPVVIQNLDLRSPAVHVVRSNSGVVGSKGMQRSDQERQKRPPQHKLSEMFELRKFNIRDGKIIYDDRTIEGTEPLVFRGISVDLGVTQQSKALYAYQMKTSQPPFVAVDANGTMDIDTLVMDLAKLSMSVESKRVDGESALPPTVQRMVNELGIAGAISIHGSGRLPFREVDQTSASVDVAITNARATLPGDRGRLDRLDVKLHADVRDGVTNAQLLQFDAQSGAASITVQEAIARADRAGWKVERLRGMIDANAPAATTQPAPIGKMRVTGGTMQFTGDASGDFASPPKYLLVARPQNVTLLLPEFTQPVQNLNGELRLVDQRLEFTNLAGDLLGGRIGSHGIISLTKPAKYEINLDIQQIELAELKLMPLFRGKAQALTGRGNLTARFSGIFPRDGTKAIDHLTSDGEVHVTKGRLWEGKAIAAIADKIGISQESVTVGDAAAVFSVRDRLVTFQRAAINTSALGLQGKGTLTFDGVIDADVVAAPLGDWKKQLQKTNIPFLSDVAGSLAGQMQKLVSGASKLLYEFQITGKVSDPQIKAVPAPALTEGATNVFGRMMQEAKSSDLLKALKD